jgi:hypothetical protein
MNWDITINNDQSRVRYKSPPEPYIWFMFGVLNPQGMYILRRSFMIHIRIHNKKLQEELIAYFPLTGSIENDVSNNIFFSNFAVYSLPQ